MKASLSKTLEFISIREVITELIQSELGNYEKTTERNPEIYEKCEKLKTIVSFMQKDFKIKELNKAVPDWITILIDIIKQEQIKLSQNPLLSFSHDDYFYASEDELAKHGEVSSRYGLLEKFKRKLVELQKTLGKDMLSRLRTERTKFEWDR